ncbi:hypothetical protein QYE76_057566 [Lolium multiflorum]|uniref:Uncharacterized protein n=1 Tax=Lolium multiflorum TaxID=4521 RepID=A0AAD8T411_LOLMU|nr:hypothetical protein QYE76_057566 [Lolium multiflorum]
MVKKKNPSAAASSTSVGAAAKSSLILPKEVAPNAPPPAPVPPAPPSSTAKPGDWTASTVTKPAEETKASPMKRSIGGFADEDDLLDFDDAFIEPPPKRARSDAVSPAAAASEASALKAAPVAQASTASSLSKGKDAPAAAAAPPSDLRGVISSLEAFASQFTSLEADKTRLQEEAKSSYSKLEGAIKKAAVARQEVDSLKEELNKLKERLKEEEARAAEKDELLRQSALALLEAADIPATPWIKFRATPRQTVFPVPSFVDDSSGVIPEIDRIQRMKDRIAQMEKDLCSTYALSAIINKKSETAADVERYALTELHKATESLNFIALNRAEESKRIHERVNALIELSSAEEIFWREHSKASAVAQFQDRVQQFTLLALMSEFGNARKIRDLVRAQVFAGAKFTLALVLAVILQRVLSIANVTGDLGALYPKVLLPANIIVDRLEKDSKVPEEKGTPQG